MLAISKSISELQFVLIVFGISLYPNTRINMPVPKKPVDQYSLNGKFIKRHSSIAEATLEMGLQKATCIAFAARNGGKSAGYYWRYAPQIPLFHDTYILDDTLQDILAYLEKP